MLKLFKKNKYITAPSFFDYSATEKKRIIKNAAKEANKMQLEMIEEYNLRFA